MTRSVLRATTALATVVWGGAVAWAQQAPVPGVSDAPIIDEVIVTARFREERAQDIGGSVAAIGEDDLQREGITDFEDIARRTVSLDFFDRGPNQNEVSIRGISSGVQTGLADTGTAGPLVSQFLDDVPVAASTASQRDFDYFDFERVEVLRGPQPTLFGEGSVGGTIRYFTKSPDLDGNAVNDSILRGKVSFTEDGGTNYAVSAASSVILVPGKLGVRGVINYRDDAGFIDNPTLGTTDVNDYDALSGRAVVLLEPNEDLSVRLSAFLGRDDIGEVNLVDAPPASPEALVSNSPIDGTSADDFDLFSGKIAYDFGPVTVTSITGYFERRRSFETFDPTAASGFATFLPVSLSVLSTLDSEDRSITEELRFVSDFDGPLNFIAGFYFQDTKLTTDILGTAPEIAPFVALPAGDTTLFQQDNVIESRQLSGFAEFTYELTERLRLIAGTRYVNEEITSTALTSLAAIGSGPLGILPPFAVIDGNAFVTAAGFPLTAEFTLNRFLPRGAVEYDLTDQALVYVQAATGVRNGNLNPASSAFQASGGSPALFGNFQTFSEDDVLSVEVGAKTRWLDDRLTANVAAYYTSYDDPQVQVSLPFVLTTNGPDARIFGVEWETNWKINDYFGAYFNGAYLNTEFVESAQLVPAVTLLGVPFDVPEGNELNNAPSWSFSAGGNVTYPIANSGLFLTGSAAYQFVGSRFATVQNLPSSVLDSQHFLNFRLGVEGDHWSVTGFVNNATNELEFQLIDGSAGLPFINANGALDYIPNAGSINRPRTVGLEVTFRY